MDTDDTTAPILDREQAATLRRSGGAHRLIDPEAPEPAAPAGSGGPATGTHPDVAGWAALLVLGTLIVLAMLVTMVLWR